MSMSGLQGCNCNLYMIKNVEDIVVFLGLPSVKVLIIPICFPAVELFKGTFVNRALPSLHGGSLKHYTHSLFKVKRR